MDPFWIYNPAVLVQNGNWYRIFPTPSMSWTEKLNAMTRLFILLTILFLFVSFGLALLPILGIVALIVYYFWSINQRALPARPIVRETFSHISSQPFQPYYSVHKPTSLEQNVSDYIREMYPHSQSY